MVDFAKHTERTSQIKRAIESDGKKNGEDKPSAALCPLRYQSVMKDILNLPVAAYVEPPPVSGEIDTAARRNSSNGKATDMTWGNQGNGQNDVYDRFNNTKPVEVRDPFIGEGQHKLVLLELSEFNHQTKGPTMRATFEVLESRVHPIGSRVTKLWFVVQPSKFASQANDGDRFADFCRKLKGAPETYPIGNDIRVLTKERAAEQLARGTMIDAMGVNTSKKADKPYVDVRWAHIPQDGASIASRRAHLDAKGGAAAPQTQPQYAQQPMQNPVPQQPYQAPQAPAPQPAPQGGFLGQLPPQGSQGGNGGGSW